LKLNSRLDTTSHAVEHPEIAMSEKDNVIKFPGAKGQRPPSPPESSQTAPVPEGRPRQQQVKASEDQAKAIQMILSGLPFVFIAIRPTGDGADFYTALHGDPTDLRNAHEHLPGVIDRLYERKGL
jgi:hypothetical protein